jgi:hypothetical protein
MLPRASMACALHNAARPSFSENPHRASSSGFSDSFLGMFQTCSTVSILSPHLPNPTNPLCTCGMCGLSLVTPHSSLVLHPPA